MSRKLKPYKVDEVRNLKTGIVVEVLFDREEKDFFAVIGTLIVRAKTADECRKLAHDALKDFSPMVWEKYIHAEMSRDTSYGWGNRRGETTHTVQLTFHFRRYERAEKYKEPGQFLTRPFREDLDESQRKYFDQDPNQFNETYYRANDNDFNAPYTEQLWHTLCELEGIVNQAKGKIHELLDPKDKGQKLLALKNAGFLLGDGKKK